MAFKRSGVRLPLAPPAFAKLGASREKKGRRLPVVARRAKTGPLHIGDIAGFYDLRLSPRERRLPRRNLRWAYGQFARAICGPQRGSVTAYGQIQTMAPRDLSGIFG